MKIKDKYSIFIFAIIVVVSLGAIMWYNNTDNNINKSNKTEAFTPRLRAAVRPHVRTLNRGYGGIISFFSWDNWRRGLRRWNL
jgi:hypothetical protein